MRQIVKITFGANFCRFFYYLCTMNETNLFLDTFSLIAPIFTAATCFTFACFSRQDCRRREERQLKNVLMIYLFLNASVWISIFCYVYFPEVFFNLCTFFLIVNILAPIFFYRILGSLVTSGLEKNFSLLHYVGPVLFAGGALVWSLISPDAHEAIRIKLMEIVGSGPLYVGLVSSPIPIIRALFVVVYFSLFVRQLFRYSRWVAYLMILSLFPLFFSLASLLQTPDMLLCGTWGAIAATAIFIQIVVITYQILRRRYLSDTEKYSETFHEEENETSLFDKSRRRVFSGTLTRERLEEWFRSKKPYLNADFKITDVMKEMDVNRTVASSFINKTYNMNFSRFVNRWRIQEFERLLSLINTDNDSVSKLHIQAGFSEIRQYHRAVETERKAKEKEKAIKSAGKNKRRKKEEK